MSTFGKFLSGIFRLIVMLLSVVAAIWMMQFPVLMNQYEEVLVSARETARPVYDETQRQAFQENYAPEAYLETLMRKSEPSDSLQVVYNTLKHFQAYDEKVTALSEAPIWKRPWVFWNISDKTTREAIDFKPQLLLDTEGITYGVIGVLLLSIVLFLLAWPLRKWRKKNAS
ncbi:MAG: DUF2937 family protein [Bacteroidota bacterium]